jgi:hypothetical protein
MLAPSLFHGGTQRIHQANSLLAQFEREHDDLERRKLLAQQKLVNMVRWHSMHARMFGLPDPWLCSMYLKTSFACILSQVRVELEDSIDALQSRHAQVTMHFQACGRLARACLYNC